MRIKYKILIKSILSTNTKFWAENEIFLRLKAERNVVVLCSSVARLAKLCWSNKSLTIFD